MKWGCSAREVLERCDSHEIQELIAFYELEPWGDEWRQTAQVTAAIWNTQLQPNDRQPTEVYMPLPPKDEINDFDDDDEREQQTIDDVKSSLAGLGLPIVVSTNGDN